MTLLPLKAISEYINVKKQGLITYETDVISDQPGIILLNNPEGDYSVTIVNQLHTSGPVKVLVKGIMHPAKKFEIGQVIGHIAVF